MVKFLKFALVGVVNTAVDIGILNILILSFRLVGSGPGYIASKAVSFACAVTVSYFLNRRYVFQKDGGKSAFLIVSVIGLVVNTLVSSAVFKVATMSQLGDSISASLLGTGSALMGTFAVLMFNYFGYKHFVFRTRAASRVA